MKLQIKIAEMEKQERYRRQVAIPSSQALKRISDYNRALVAENEEMQKSEFKMQSENVDLKRDFKALERQIFLQKIEF